MKESLLSWMSEANGSTG